MRQDEGVRGLDLPERGSIDAYTAQERPDLWQDARSLFLDVWPEYNLHGNDTGSYFGALFPQHAHLQVLFFDRTAERVVARGRTIPFAWDGTLDDLPRGIDAVGKRAIESRQPPTALSALAAEVAVDRQGEGLSRILIQAMAVVAREAGLTALVAPVRPRWKDRYPLTPVERYAWWRRDDNLPFDPWLRVHARLGATILRPEAESLRIEAPVDDWERWTEMAFPEDGDYVFPLGLSPLHVADGVGSYWEPNVWMHHEL
jgi:GNAT superfamily N-acetyltransferase